jgi:hypothetical protein
MQGALSSAPRHGIHFYFYGRLRPIGDLGAIISIARGGISPLPPPLPARDSPSSPALLHDLKADSHDPEGRFASSRRQSHEPGTGQLIDYANIPVASSKERDNASG